LGTAACTPARSAPSFDRAIRLTASPAHEIGPAISPDGKWVAYLSDARGVSDVWVKFIAGGEAANLTATSNLDIQTRSTIGAALRWSPDGKQVAYIRPAGTGGDALLVADAHGEHARELVPPRGGVHNHGPAWSPDGRHVYFTRTIANWNDEPAEIYRVPVAGGSPEAVISSTRRAIFPVLAADGGLFYAANPTGVDLSLWWKPPGDAASHRLTTGIGEYAEPRVSPDGRLLVSTLIDYRRLLVTVPITPSPQHTWTEVTDGFGGDVDPFISRSGRMVFSSSRSGHRNLWTANMDGSDLRPLTSDAAIEERPTLSADGQQVAFVSDRTGQRGIWTVPADGGAPRRVVSAPVLDSVTWSPDATQIAYAVPGERFPALSVVSVADGSTRRLTTPRGAYSPAWSPREDVIAYIETTGESGGVGNHVKVVTGSGDPVHVDLPAGPRLPNGYLAWAPDGTRLAVASVLTNAAVEISVVELGAHDPFRRALELPAHLRLRGLGFGADGASLVLGIQEALSDIVLFVRDGGMQ
jgi:Tol biopolymer transport system component